MEKPTHFNSRYQVLNGLILILFWGGIFFAETKQAQAQWLKGGMSELRSPLLDGEPFDLIVLNENGENAVMKVAPPVEPFPSNPPDAGMYVFEFSDGERFQVPFTSIDRYLAFNDLVLQEADAWLNEQNFAGAFRNYLYVYDRGGKTQPRVVDSLQKVLFLDAAENFRLGRFEFSLTIFEDLYKRDPSFQVPGIDKSLIEIILLCYDGILQNDFESEEYNAIPQKMEFLREKYGDDAADIDAKWRNRFDEKVEQLLAEANRFADDGQGRLAHLATRKAEQLRPGLPAIKLLQEDLLKRFPLIVIGTSQPGADIDVNRVDHWGARRVGRLVQRTIVELIGIAEEGGRYALLNGSMSQIDEQGYLYALEINETPTGFGTPPASPFLIASRLLAAADPQSPVFSSSWQKVLKSVQIDDGRVIVALRMPFLNPAPLMRIPFLDPTESTDRTVVDPANAGADTLLDAVDWSDSSRLNSRGFAQNGLYQISQESERETIFEPNPDYDPIPGYQQPVLIEQLYRTDSDAVDDLIRGNIDIVDRVPPSDLRKLRLTEGVVVRSYLVPTVHLLVPKIRGDFANSPYFRSGLSHGIDRQLLIEKTISGGVEIPGNEVVSGPFPIGTEENEQIGYAYNIQVRPPRFQEKMAQVLIIISLILDAQTKEKAAQRERAEMQRQTQLAETREQSPDAPPKPESRHQGSEDETQDAKSTDGEGNQLPDQMEGVTGADDTVTPSESPRIVIAYPASTTAAESSKAIARMWNNIGIETSLRALRPHESVPPDDDWDILYLELSIEEPLTDIAKVAGRDGIASDLTAVSELTLQQLATVNSWRRASNQLRRLHRQLAVDLSIIPLYQVKEHYAFRNTVSGVGRELIHLYQNVDRWRIDVYGKDED